MGKIENSSGSVSIIGGSDGPTSVFIVGSKKKTVKQRIKKYLFNQRKKWYADRIKPEAHTMVEVVEYVKNTYGFVEMPKEDKRYQQEYQGLRASFIMQHAPELLGEYAANPVLFSRDEEGVREFQKQVEIRQQKAMGISEEAFPVDFHVLSKVDEKAETYLYLESRFGYIGGSFKGHGKGSNRQFRKMYRDIHRYFGVTQEDIVNETQRYMELLTTLSMKG